MGSNNVDLITYIDRMPNPGETLAAPSFSMGFGGKGSNQAVACARLGCDVVMVARIGDDLFGPMVVANMAEAGVDVTHCRVAPGTPSGVAPIFVDGSGENAILIVAGANGQLSPADVDDAADALARCDVILLQLEVPLETVFHTVAWAAAQGIPTVLNPAPALPSLDLSRFAGLTWLTPNQGELAMLTGLPTETEDEIAAAVRVLMEHGVGQVVVTLGGRGARLFDQNGVTQIDPVAVDPVDTTGAGDAFIGCFATHLASGLDAPDALAEAARYAALSITQRGTQTSYATPAEFAAFKATLA